MKTISINKINKQHYKGDVYNLELQTNRTDEKDDLFWVEQKTSLKNHNCFAKDINAITYYAESLGCNLDIMRKIWELNLKYRTNLDWGQIPGAVTNKDINKVKD